MAQYAANYGLNAAFEYTEYQIDSFDATESANQQFFTTDWPLIDPSKPLDDVVALKVLEAQIPFTFYLFNRFNNTFQLTEIVNGNSSTSTVTIPEGNYNINTIQSALSIALNAASTVNGNNLVYSVCYAPALLKLCISSNDGTTGDYFILTFGTSLYDLGQENPRLWLGFSGGTNMSSIGPNPSILAPSVVQLTGPNYLYLCSRALGAQTGMYLPGNSKQNPGFQGADGPQICKIPFIEEPGQVCNWQDPDPQKWFPTGKISMNRRLDFYVVLGTDPTERPVEFNGTAFSFKLGVLIAKKEMNETSGVQKGPSSVQYPVGNVY